MGIRRRRRGYWSNRRATVKQRLARRRLRGALAESWGGTGAWRGGTSGSAGRTTTAGSSDPDGGSAAAAWPSGAGRGAGWG